MKILHTSDWHIGHKLYDHSRFHEHEKFLEWLISLIAGKQVDLLLVSGDIFDSVSPPAESVDQYYRFLFRLHRETEAAAVIVSGNHDSLVRLAAPRKFLEMARIFVNGRLTGTPGEFVTVVSSGGCEVAVASVPYIPEGEILSHVALEKSCERALRYREAMRRVYEDCVPAMPQGIPRILMGHLFLQGGLVGDSERAVQFGGSEPLLSSDLPDGVDYMALGHLHRPQQIHGKTYPLVYPGSPLPLTFREASYGKKVSLLDFSEYPELRYESLEVPLFQELCQVKGTFDELLVQASEGEWEEKYIEVRMLVDRPAAGCSDAIRKAFSEKGGRVLVVDVYTERHDSAALLSAEEVRIKTPEQIFEAYYQSAFGSAPPEDFEELRATFGELLELAGKEEEQ